MKGFQLFSDKRNWGYPPSYEILPAFGIKPGSHIPDEYREIMWMGKDRDGAMTEIKVVILPIAESRRLHPGSTKPRRVHAQCPTCERLVCAGHTIQHRCK
jgi:hypothetical protein